MLATERNLYLNIIHISLYNDLIICNKILQPISEQHTAMVYYEDSDVINLINLHVVVAQIFNEIFIHDFSLTDITSPGINFNLIHLKDILRKNKIVYVTDEIHRAKTT